MQKTESHPAITLPDCPGLRDAVKAGLQACMTMPLIGGPLRTLVAHQTVFPNFRVDQLTRNALEILLTPGSNCLDVGAHSGEILEMMIEFARDGYHCAIEPIKELADRLSARYETNKRVTVHNCAVSESEGVASFYHVKSSPGFSGLARRRFNRETTQEMTLLKVRPIDDLLGDRHAIDLIKLDIEGAELLALNGAKRVLERDKPHLIIEFQKKAASYFGYGPAEMFKFLAKYGYKVWGLDDWLQSAPNLTLPQLSGRFESDPNLYLMAKARD